MLNKNGICNIVVNGFSEVYKILLSIVVRAVKLLTTKMIDKEVARRKRLGELQK